jgi:hypothetical protein
MRLRDEKADDLSNEFDGVELGPEPNIVPPGRTGERHWADRESQKQCYRCGEQGHMQATCTKPPGLSCYACGDLGHKARDCRNNSPIMSGGGNAIKEPIKLMARSVLRPQHTNAAEVRRPQNSSSAHAQVATGANAVPVQLPPTTAPAAPLQQRQPLLHHVVQMAAETAQHAMQPATSFVNNVTPLPQQSVTAAMSHMDARLDSIVCVVNDVSSCMKTLSEFVHNNMLADQASHMAGAAQNYAAAAQRGAQRGVCAVRGGVGAMRGGGVRGS